MKQFNTREELLQDTIDYYWGKPERRCLNPARKCSYKPFSDLTEGCAIGRLVDDETKDSLEMHGFGIQNDSQFNKLPKWLQELGKDFLNNLQVLHDTRAFTDKVVNHVKDSMQSYVDLTKIKFPN